MKILSFDTSVYPFHEVIEKFIGTDDLTAIEANFEKG
jgi:hypothetical protein